MQGKGKAHAKKNAKVGIKMVCGEGGKKEDCQVSPEWRITSWTTLK